MTDQKLVLVVEDEEKIAHLLLDYLHSSGYRSHWIADGDQVVEWVHQHTPDMVLLDLMLPGKDGIEICRELRTFSELPVIMVTARVEEIDRILGLEIGANDYICKPFSPREVMAHIKALFRTLASATRSKEQLPQSIVLDEGQMLATVKGYALELTPVEFRLLKTLVSQPGRIFSRGQLMGNLYEDNRVVTDRTVDTHVKNLRRKIADTEQGADLIKSVYGVGYKFDPHSAE